MPTRAPGCARRIEDGLRADETLLTQDEARGREGAGDAPTLADASLTPQVESARHFKVDLRPTR